MSDEFPSQSVTVPPPPLGIIHLLVWTAITAVGLTIVQNLSMDQEKPTPFDLINRIWFAAMFGLALGAVLLMGARRSRGMPFPVQPGEYWLVASGIGTTIHVVCWGAYVAVFGTRMISGLWMFYLGYFVALAADYWAARNVEPANWRALFWTKLCFNAVEALLIGTRFDGGMLNVYWTVVSLETVITIPWLLMLCRSDRRIGIRRGWLHYLGVACWILASIHAIAWWLWMYLVEF